MNATAAIAFDRISLTLKPHFFSAHKALLEDVSFRVAPGECCALLGANGAGKTTLLRVLLGLYRSSFGTGVLDGYPMGTPASRRRLGFLAERPALPLEYTPLAFVTFAAKQSGLHHKEATKRAEEALARVGLSAHQTRRMRHYSKGMLQRVGLAQAVVHKPHVLVLDEPLSGLDPPARRDVRVLLQQEKARGAAILFSTHILSDVISTCDKAAVLVRGRVTHFAAPYALLEEAAAKDGAHAQVEIVVRHLSPSLARTLAEQHGATLSTEDALALRLFAPSIAAANALLRALMTHEVSVLSVEQDTRLLEQLLVPSEASMRAS